MTAVYCMLTVVPVQINFYIMCFMTGYFIFIFYFLFLL